MMNVLTLDQAGFDDACISLANRILVADDLKVVIGIKTGGAIVGKNVYASLCASGQSLKYFEVGASRYTTAAKNLNGIRKVFRFSPYFLLDFLRILEHLALRLRMQLKKNVDRSVLIDSELLAYISTISEGCVFVVDDAVDSGATLKGVLDTLRMKNPSLDYKSAVITLTQKKPIVQPDVYLYSDVLIRFPWSNDYK